MELIIVLFVLVMLALAAVRFGVDTRDGRASSIGAVLHPRSPRLR